MKPLTRKQVRQIELAENQANRKALSDAKQFSQSFTENLMSYCKGVDQQIQKLFKEGVTL